MTTSDATFCIGTLTLGHAPTSGLEELVRVTGPGAGGLHSHDLDLRGRRSKEMQDDLEAVGRWQLVEADRQIHILPKGEPELEHDIWVYRVLR